MTVSDASMNVRAFARKRELLFPAGAIIFVALRGERDRGRGKKRGKPK